MLKPYHNGEKCMTNPKRGWWTLKIEGVDIDDVSDSTKEHIAEMIRQGCVWGEVIEDSSDGE